MTYIQYSNTYHKAIKMKHVDVNPSMYIDFKKENCKEGPKFKLVTMLAYQNTKIFFKKFKF